MWIKRTLRQAHLCVGGTRSLYDLHETRHKGPHIITLGGAAAEAFTQSSAASGGGGGEGCVEEEEEEEVFPPPRRCNRKCNVDSL